MADKEKRKEPRHQVYIPVVCWDMENGLRAGRGRTINTKNLCSDGMAFYSKEMISIGTVLSLDIQLPNQKKPIICQLHVVSIERLPERDGYLIGGAFEGISADNRRDIARTLDKLDLYVLLESALAGGASDLHLTVGHPPMVRRGGRILTMAADAIEAGEVQAMIFPLLAYHQILYLEENKELDFTFSPDMASRFRVNLHFQKGYLEAALRSLPTRIRDFSELGLPEDVMERLCHQKSGLIIIAGASGSGKTATMMAMVDFMNKTQERVIVTIEDPIEYALNSQRSIIKQRELGIDTPSYAAALKHIRRQDPDVVCLGEIFNGESLAAAVHLASTGCLVVSTFNATSTTSALERLVNLFPSAQSAGLCQQLSAHLYGILFQMLIPNKQQGGSCVATEVLLNTVGMKNVIREGRFTQIATLLQTGRGHGMRTIKESLNELYEKGLIDYGDLTSFNREEHP